MVLGQIRRVFQKRRDTVDFYETNDRKCKHRQGGFCLPKNWQHGCEVGSYSCYLVLPSKLD